MKRKRVINFLSASGTVIGFALFMTTLVWGIFFFWAPVTKEIGFIGVFGGFTLMVVSPLFYRFDELPTDPTQQTTSTPLAKKVLHRSRPA